MGQMAEAAHKPLNDDNPTGCRHRPGYMDYSWGRCIECWVPWPCEHAARTHP